MRVKAWPIAGRENVFCIEEVVPPPVLHMRVSSNRGLETGRETARERSSDPGLVEAELERVLALVRGLALIPSVGMVGPPSPPGALLEACNVP